jgi:hypothetical protein
LLETTDTKNSYVQKSLFLFLFIFLFFIFLFLFFYFFIFLFLFFYFFIFLFFYFFIFYFQFINLKRIKMNEGFINFLFCMIFFHQHTFTTILSTSMSKFKQTCKRSFILTGRINRFLLLVIFRTNQTTSHVRTSSHPKRSCHCLIESK